MLCQSAAFFVFVNGQQVAESKGAVPKKNLENLFLPYLGALSGDASEGSQDAEAANGDSAFTGDLGIMQRRGR